MGVQQCLINPGNDLKAILEYLCSESNKVHNCALYYARQVWFKTRKFVTGFDLVNEIGSNKHFSALPSEVAVQTCLSVGESVKSFAKLLEKVSKGELDQKPKFPHYRRGQFQVVAFPKRALRLEGNNIRLPLGLRVKAWFGLKEFHIPMPSNLEFNLLKEVRILPRNGVFYAEFVYPTQLIKAEVSPENVLGIDHGIDNWLTCVSNAGTSFIVDGRHLKSLNQWYNKRVSILMVTERSRSKENQPQAFWSKQLAQITERRNRQVRDAINKAARLVINHCLENQIGTVVFGWNKGQKDSINLGSKTNQKFVQIPTGRLKDRIKQLCEQYGIKFVETEESYTSKASFLDSDELPTFGEKPEGWQESGKRVKRGLYRTATNWYINADCNGAANILRKVATTLGFNLSGVGRGALTTPLRSRFWTLKESQCL